MFGATILVAVALVGYTYFSPRLRQVSSATFGDDPTAPLLASEVGRFRNFSLIQITGYAQSQFGPPTVAKLLSDIAEARNADYCIALKIWSNPDGSRMSVVGFTNKMDAVATMMAIAAWFDREEKSNQRVEQIMKRSQTIDELDAIGIQATADELEHVGWLPEDDIATVRAKLGR
jgi:hypothetical protein